LAEFHKRLQARLIEKPAAEVLRLKKRLQELDMTIQRMKRLALDPEIGEDVFRNELAQATSEQKLKTAQLDTLMHRTAQVTEAAVQMQSSIDPLKLIKRLLEGEPEVYKVRATLKRLVKKFVFVARPRKYVSVFEISFCQGVGVAQVSNSEVLDDLLVTYRVTVTTSSVRPTQWRVEGERI
jgi:site-specific DNA recombinase